MWFWVPAVPWLCPTLSCCLPASYSISSLFHLLSCLTPFRGHPLISSLPLGPMCWHKVLLAVLPRCSGMLMLREGSQRHLHQMRTSPWGGNLYLISPELKVVGYPPCSGILQLSWPLPPNHQKQQNTGGQRASCPCATPRSCKAALIKPTRVPTRRLGMSSTGKSASSCRCFGCSSSASRLPPQGSGPHLRGDGRGTFPCAHTSCQLPGGAKALGNA